LSSAEPIHPYLARVTNRTFGSNDPVHFRNDVGRLQVPSRRRRSSSRYQGHRRCRYAAVTTINLRAGVYASPRHRRLSDAPYPERAHLFPHGLGEAAGARGVLGAGLIGDAVGEGTSAAALCSTE
jgi:hypothetical protein